MTLKSGSYINSGVIVFNLQMFRQQNLTQKLIRIIRKYGNNLIFPDQDIFNYGIETEFIKYLPLRYNYWIGMPERVLYRKTKNSEHLSWEKFCDERNNMVVMHFIPYFLERKAWHLETKGLGKKFYLKYRELTPWKAEPLEHRFSEKDRRRWFWRSAVIIRYSIYYMPIPFSKFLKSQYEALLKICHLLQGRKLK